MRVAVFHSIVLLLVLGSSLSAQSSPDDMRRLRELLGLGPGKEIRNVASSKVSSGSGPLRVFLATGNDKDARHYYAREIKQWNRYRNANVAALELDDDINRADIILARYSLNEKAQTSTSSIAVYEQTYDPATRTTTSKPEIRTETYRTVKFNGYILRRNGPDLEILRQSVFAQTKKEGTVIGEGLWAAFVELLSAP